MTDRTVFLNPIEPALLSARSAMGCDLNLQITFRKQDASVVDAATLLPQLAVLPRSRPLVSAYDVSDSGFVTVPGSVLNDTLGYTLELYQRRVADNPDDPPVPVGLLAKGVLRIDGSAYWTQGPLGPLTFPTVVGPQGPQGVQGTDGREGVDGPPGPANILAIGTVTSGAPGTPADATITGTSPAQTLNLTLTTGDTGVQGVQGVQGVPGPANVLTVGTVMTLPPGSPATVTITGTPPTQTINFGIPSGLTGATGATGTNITLGTALPGSAPDGALFWNTATNTLYVREAGAWVPVEATWGA